MEDLPHQAARYLEALYEEATAAGRAFRRMGLPQRRSSNGSFASSGGEPWKCVSSEVAASRGARSTWEGPPASGTPHQS